MDPASLEKLKASLTLWRINEIYYYATTFDEEVTRIWPQSNRKIGKIMYLLSRYSNIVAAVLSILTTLPTHSTMSPPACIRLFRAFVATSVVAVNIPEAIFWVCIFALLGGRRRYMVLMIAAYLAFFVPIQVMQGITYSKTEAFPPLPWEEEIGYMCSLDGLQMKPYSLIVPYINLARTVFVTVLAIVTLFVRYRKQNGNRLIRIIQREGGMFYFCASVTGIFTGLAQVPGVLPDKYAVTSRIRKVVLPVFADRLLLYLQAVEDPGTRAEVSALIFGTVKDTKITEATSKVEEETELQQV
ncbi:hypothetical protein DFP72DRAFT_1053430 [Ephemerocybe angulata]|uniref:DUF6533 domain-containing protein n=1 Tax=Ephemerocybe angulata TaxID=980116 RepID=A0A8H6LUH3_9AGAR|nr:hypothetical protein DFP72DRAFT_1053430 [Tulosesus angulatus]